MSASAPLLEVSDLKVSFATEDGIVNAVDGVSFSVRAGEVVAIVGESGSGKSVTSMTLMGLTRGPNARFEGTAKFAGRDLVTAPESELERIRGGDIAMIFQDPMSSLDPVYRIGSQIVEQIRAHDSKISKPAAFDRAIELMERVGVPHARERLRSYPHEFSGGMRQRVVIAMALSCNPKLLIADEPTTALDVTTQAQILDLMRTLQRTHGSSIVIITHDMGVISELADRVVVMYAGRPVEQGPKRDVIRSPRHPYTWGLLGAVPRVDGRRNRLATIPGSPISPLNLPPGCAFGPRCACRFAACEAVPPLSGDGAHLDACWLPVEGREGIRVSVTEQAAERSTADGGTA